MRRLFFLALLSAFLSTGSLRADTLVTMEGKRYEGTARFDPRGFIIIQQYAGSGVRVEISNVLMLRFNPRKPTDGVLTFGVVLIDGTSLPLESFRLREGSFIAKGPGEKKDQPISVGQIARLVVAPITPAMEIKLSSGAVGALLRAGDFIDGAIVSADASTVVVDSVLFGQTRLNSKNEAAVAVMNSVSPLKGEYIVRLSNGAAIATDAIALEKDRLVFEHPFLGKQSAAAEEVMELSYRGDRVRYPLIESPPALDSSSPAGAEMAINSGLRGLSSDIFGLEVGQSISVTPGSIVRFDLDEDTKTFICTAGVSRSALPNVAMRFIVRGDGRELFKSKEVTSLDDPVAVSVTLQKSRSILLIAEPANDAMFGAAVWADPIAIKAQAQ